MKKVNKKLRNKTINNLGRIIEEIWGSRCYEAEFGCPCCAAWAVFDNAVHLTDLSYFEDEEK